MQIPDIGSIQLPVVDLEKIELPSIDLMAVEIPKLDLPSSVPSFDGLSFGTSDLTLPAVGFVVLLGIISILVSTSTKNNSASSKSPQLGGGNRQKSKTNLAVPYDAAARLAYDNWCASHDNAKFNSEAYNQFKRIYEAKAIAEAKSKKLARDLKHFDNDAVPIVEPAIPKVVAVETNPPMTAKVEESPFFYAEV